MYRRVSRAIGLSRIWVARCWGRARLGVAGASSSIKGGSTRSPRICYAIPSLGKTKCLKDFFRVTADLGLLDYAYDNALFVDEKRCPKDT